MVAFRALTLALFAGLALAAPLDSASSSSTELVARQSSTWNDPYIKKPYAFQAQDIGNCNFQLTFRRDGFDSRHTLRFYATYSGSSTRREITPISGNYTLSNTGIADYGRYTVPNNYAVSVHQFKGICSSGTSGNKPTALFSRSTLGSGYNYRNDFISPAISGPVTTLPSPPSNVKVARVAGTTGNYTTSWTPSSTATGGHFVLIRIDVYASELGGYIPGTRTMITSPGQNSVTFKIYSNDRLSSVAVSAQAATDVVSDATRVPIIPAPQ
ncbi:unnamed protein product [Tilletia controversa]|uniref:Uncharacterized protein n=3 Tax=Tilletia TaxID=13289 RepID=A0A8X7MYZ4_9BASI|nr:hypothetical protein CF336_g828 [Tilletia laevis]KAE8204084.1 hypothetical protein CF328_g1292 [Tilletia controversa]KAE8264553.1 hypothetical protein A4X03_0g866 [Tilletia caries]KAE8207990.1 hypothetical protein CF335_g748 [Tilletia laevis]KAE8253036.1 hypothetical protein A4X06_0g1739 [Tilletia controversa]